MTTPTDRELLERAAKAAGIHVISPIEKWIAQPNKEHEGGFLVRNDSGGDSAWNPLKDDGDALRLAVKLNLSMRYEAEPDGAIVVVYPNYDIDFKWPYVFENLEGPKSQERVRRAIVRAAASLGANKHE